MVGTQRSCNEHNWIFFFHYFCIQDQHIKSSPSSCYFHHSNCIIDKNAKIGSNVIIANKEVSFLFLSLMPHNLPKQISVFLTSFICTLNSTMINFCLVRVFKKRTDRKKVSTLDQESRSYWRMPLLKMVLLYDNEPWQPTVSLDIKTLLVLSYTVLFWPKASWIAVLPQGRSSDHP